MLAFVEFSPLLAFGLAYWLGGVYVATGVLMGAMVVAMLVAWRIKGKISPMNAISTALVLVLGTATLVLRNVHFIQWKPSVFLWIVGAAFLVSAFIGKMPLAQRLLQSAAPDLDVEPRYWQWANAAFVLFCAVAGAANLFIAYNASEANWIRFKVIGLPVAMMLTMFGVMMWLLSRQKPDKAA
ncbi:MAG: septation protein IspZ [Nevskiaceae bacterium]|jgi:intracellular septation protein|nr:septation protein IspZ [Nevskiaceae bacterium]